MTYTIHLPVYEGPLDLLLELIQRAELDITKIALAQVTDQYLAYLRQAQEHKLADLSAFLVIAARLLQIKSEALLPRPPERDPGEEDPGEALAQQLIAYRRFKRIARYLAERQQAGLRTFVRLAPPPLPESKLDLGDITLQDLRRAMQHALATAPSPQPLSQAVAPHRIRIRDKIHLILEALRRERRTTFRKLLKRVRSRLEIVVSFLAMLELVKQRQIDARQEHIFGEIEIVPGEAWREDQELDFDLEFEE